MRWLAAMVLVLGGLPTEAPRAKAGGSPLGLLSPALSQSAALPAPGFHHLHLHSTNPDAAIDFYTRQFPTTAEGIFAGQPSPTRPGRVRRTL